MVSSKLKIKFAAITTFLLVSSSIICSSYNTLNAEENGSRSYVKYNFETGVTSTYSLPDVSVAQANALIATASTVDTTLRENAEDSSVVRTVSGNSVGTGFIIGEHEIMTAAHCAYTFNPTMKVQIKPDGEDEFIELNVASAHVPSSYINAINSGGDSIYYDYAILTVEENLSAYGSYYLGMDTGQFETKNSPIHALGYEGEELKISNSYDIYDLGLHYNTKLDTATGSSGGPIFVRTGVVLSGNMTSYKTAISIMTEICYVIDNGEITRYGCGPKIVPEIVAFAYDNDYL